MPVRRTRRSQRFLRVCVLALLLASGLAACNGSTDDEPPPAATETAPSTAVPAAEPAPATPVPAAEPPQPPATPPDAPIPELPAEPAGLGEPSPPAAERPAPAPRSFRYDTYDLGGAVAEPGHYAFLADPGDPTSAVTTYEGLRDGTATALRIHTHDAHGVPQADLYDAVEAGDLVEWRQAADCFVRYQVTAAPEPAADTDIRAIGVAWMTYAFTGCSGPIAGDTAATFEWGDLPDLGGTSLTVPIRHALWQIVPESWTGATEASYGVAATAVTPGRVTTLAEARLLPRWRDPDLPAEWVFWHATVDPTVTPYGYEAFWGTGNGGTAIIIRAEQVFSIGEFRYAAGRRDGKIGVHESRVIAGRPAVVQYSPAGPTMFPTLAVVVFLHDPDTDTAYTLYGLTKTLRGSNVDAMIAIAESLFAEGSAP